jgi:hypothetical protein
LTWTSSLLTAANFSLVSDSLSFAIKRLLSAELVWFCFSSLNSFIFSLRFPFKIIRASFTSLNSSVFANNSPIFIDKRSLEAMSFFLFSNADGSVLIDQGMLMNIS